MDNDNNNKNLEKKNTTRKRNTSDTKRTYTRRKNVGNNEVKKEEVFDNPDVSNGFDERLTMNTERVEEKNSSNYNSNGSNFIFGVLVALIVILIFAVILVQNNIIHFDIGNKSNVELKTTETTNKVKEGVYVTDVSDIVEEVMPSIVSITSKSLISTNFFGYSFDRYVEGAGSGIIVGKSDKELLILTNNHVVADSKELSVQFIDEKSYDATIKGTSERKDVAVIAIKLSSIDKSTLEEIKVATLGDSDILKVGDGVIAIGNALGYGQSVTTGVVSALNRKVQGDSTGKMIQIDAAINGGNSGGALLDSTGAVIGINSAKYSSSGSSSQASIEGMGFAIPISDVKKLITNLMNGKDESTSGATIGIEGYMISEENNMNIPKGFYIVNIVSKSGAEKAGLEIGYIIVKIDGKKVEEFSDITDVLDDKEKGDTVKLTVKYPSGSKYKEKEVKVTLS